MLRMTRLGYIFIKEISQIENEDDKKRIIEEFIDRFGKLSKEVLLYIEEKYLESLFRYFKITNVMETKNAVSVIIPNEILEKLKLKSSFYHPLKLMINLILSTKIVN